MKIAVPILEQCFQVFAMPSLRLKPATAEYYEN
jgi:hypothetical protein